MELEPSLAPEVASPICATSLRLHAFASRDGLSVRCKDCALVMPLAAVMRDGPDARHCLACGWWSPEEDCRAMAAWCVWCKAPFDE